VFFREGVQREIQYEDGITKMRSSVTSDGVRASLNRIGVSEQLLEVASPAFQEADTLIILQDGTRLVQANMTRVKTIIY